jgi:hypothetical protein
MNLGHLSNFCSLLWSLSSVVCNLPYRGHLHPLISLFLGIWFFFEAIVSAIVFLLSFSIYSFLVYRKATDFCKLILYPATFLKLFMVSRSLGVEFFGYLRYRIMSSAYRDTLKISLAICIPFISSSCLIALARNYRNMLNRSGESRHSCLIPDIRGNGFSFFSLNMILTTGLSYNII